MHVIALCLWTHQEIHDTNGDAEPIHSFWILNCTGQIFIIFCCRCATTQTFLALGNIIFPYPLLFYPKQWFACVCVCVCVCNISEPYDYTVDMHSNLPQFFPPTLTILRLHYVVVIVLYSHYFCPKIFHILGSHKRIVRFSMENTTIWQIVLAYSGTGSCYAKKIEF